MAEDRSARPSGTSRITEEGLRALGLRPGKIKSFQRQQTERQVSPQETISSEVFHGAYSLLTGSLEKLGILEKAKSGAFFPGEKPTREYEGVSRREAEHVWSMKVPEGILIGFPNAHLKTGTYDKGITLSWGTDNEREEISIVPLGINVGFRRVTMNADGITEVVCVNGRISRRVSDRQGKLKTNELITKNVKLVDLINFPDLKAIESTISLLEQAAG